MNARRSILIMSIGGYMLLFYIWILLPIHLYEPSRSLNLPHILWFIHLMTLYIHEAGHLFFRLFGETLYMLGGSLMQVLIPFVWLIVAWREGSKLTPVALFFTGESIVDVSIYMKDAEFRLLSLLGGSHVRHDWGTLLTNADMIDAARPLGNVVFFLGLAIAFSAIVWGIYSAGVEYKSAPRTDGQVNPPTISP